MAIAITQVIIAASVCLVRSFVRWTWQLSFGIWYKVQHLAVNIAKYESLFTLYFTREGCVLYFNLSMTELNLASFLSSIMYIIILLICPTLKTDPQISAYQFMLQEMAIFFSTDAIFVLLSSLLKTLIRAEGERKVKWVVGSKWKQKQE